MGQKKSKPTFTPDPNGDGTLPKAAPAPAAKVETKPAPAPAAKVETPAPVAAPVTAEPAPAPVKEDPPARTEQTPVESVQPAAEETSTAATAVVPEPVDTAATPASENTVSEGAPAEPEPTPTPAENPPATETVPVTPEPVETEPVESAPVVEKAESADDVSVDAAPVLVSPGAGEVVETSMGAGILLDRRGDGVDVVELGWQLANNSKAVLYKSSPSVAGPVPIGHTEFSWKSKGSAGVPIGHTEFTWK